tara:strand:+ start:213 stop:974 length:762 start_codon:yes stop_codon:yes gene_type:complete
MKNNYIEYNELHWSKIKSPQKALDKYLNNYKDIYNLTNINKIIDVIPNGKRLKILDFGGGIGFLSAELFKLGHDVTLCDQSEEALNTASYFFKNEKYDIKILKAEKGYINDNNKYDIIVLKDLIEHVIEDKKMFLDLFSLLEKRGKIIITTQNKVSLNYLIEGTYKKIKNPKKVWLGWDRTHVRFYTPKSLRAIAKDSQVKKIEFRSSYIFPYKILNLIFRSKKIKFYKLDLKLMKLKIFRKIGWNIMMICHK